MPIQSLAIVQVLTAFMACINNNNNDDFVVVFCETLQCCSTVCEHTNFQCVPGLTEPTNTPSSQSEFE